MIGANPETRITVIGAGAIGGWLAARLAMSGANVSILARGDTLAAIRSDGLQLTSGEEIHSVAVNASDDPQAFGPQDVLIIAVKAPALADAAEIARPLIGSETVIVPMMNGVPWWFLPSRRLESIDPGGRIADALPASRIVGSVVHAACSRTAPGQIRVAHSDRLILGEPRGGASARVDALCALFEEAGITCEASADIRRAIWYKLWGNATINPLSALTRSTADRLLADASLRALMLAAMDELAAVGAAIACPISESGEDRIEVTARLGAFKPSMLQDVEAGRPIELDALVGAPREIARLVGVPTPNLDLIDSATRLMAESLGLLPD